jgi:polyhydroxyalkanoate synthesis repressor PhaR
VGSRALIVSKIIKEVTIMTESPIIIKKYANRRLYNTDESRYITLRDLSILVKQDRPFVVQDAKTGEDMTRSVLAQLILDLDVTNEAPLLPVDFLRHLVRFYDDRLRSFIPSYLDMAMTVFSENQDRMNSYVHQALTPFDDARRWYRGWFEQSFSFFQPFLGRNPFAPPSAASAAESGTIETLQKEIDRLKQELLALKSKNKT